MNSYEKKFKCKFWWSLNTYLAHEIVRGIDCLLKSRSFGYPNGTTEKSWRRILTDIRDGFQTYIDDDYGEFLVWKDGRNPHKVKWIKNPDGTIAMERDPRDYKCKLVVDKKRKRKFEKGMKLFVKYFDSLWD